MHFTSGIAVILLCGFVYGLTDEEIKRDFTKEIMICTKDFPADMSDLLELEKLKPPTKTNIKCLLACVYKKIHTNRIGNVSYETRVYPGHAQRLCGIQLKLAGNCDYCKLQGWDMNKEGIFDIAEGYKFAEKVNTGDEKRVENGKKLADICIKVNDETVSDGAKGCDRAALMFNCVVEHAPKLGFKL